MIHSKDLKFSFSGLKTAVLYLLKKLGEIDENKKKEIAREFEDAVTEVLISKTQQALEDYEAKSLIIGGGVVANKHIQEAFKKLPLPVYIPDSHLTGDNALMIAHVGTIKPLVESRGFIAEGNLSL